MTSRFGLPHASSLLRRALRVTLLAGALGLTVAGCGGAEETGPSGLTGPPTGVPVPDFSLQDVNPNSATNMAMVSPRQELTRISAWYFGHST